MAEPQPRVGGRCWAGGTVPFSVVPFLLAVVAGTLLVLAFPPVGWGWTTVGAIALFLGASLRAHFR